MAVGGRSLARTAVVLALVLGGSLLLARCLVDKLGGDFAHQPAELAAGLGPGARALVDTAFSDIDPARLIDHHVHLVGLGQGGTGCFLHEDMDSPLSPLRFLRFLVYKSAAGIANEENLDQDYVLRLVDLARHLEKPGRLRILAFDKHHGPDGTVNLEKTEFYTPNEYVFEIAAKHPDLFLPGISVHPYRPDALEELEKWATRGGRVVKWLPNAMGMDPADPRCDPFYEKMRELGLVLLTHAGEEQAVESEEDQRLGNPLRLRRPLDRGVKVVVAHCASLGEGEDLDHPERPLVSNFRLFLRLMEDKRYEGLLFADISAMLQFNRLGDPIRTILERDDLHHRLVNGSDYPLPAVNVVIDTGDLVEEGHITEEERADANEIYEYNPLLFDFVLKRTVRLPGTEKRFPAAIFMRDPARGP